MKHTLLFSLIGLAPLHAQDPLRWGCDPAGGAPFVYKSKSDAAGPYLGFEVEIAEYLARKLGRTAVMVEGDWAQLPLQLGKPADVDKGVDLILNGYELRKDLCNDYAATRPYYLFKLSLIARKDSPLKSWDDLPGRNCVVLGGTAAHDYVRTRFGDRVEIPVSPDVANVFDLVSKGRFESTVQDSPAAVHFLKEYPDLVSIGEPVRPGYGAYVIYYRKDDLNLGKHLNAAIADGVRDGSFERIYRKYDLWTDDQNQLAAWQTREPYPPPFDDKAQRWPYLIRELLWASLTTIKLAVLSFPLAMIAGLLIGLGRVYGGWWLRWPLTVYVEVIRGTPLLLQLFIIYQVIPEIFRSAGFGILVDWLSPMHAGILGLAINYSAYEAENYRAGLQAVPGGQLEAALALGLTRRASIRRIVVPQAWRIVIPSVTNDFIALFKDTSACYIIFISELTRKYNDLYNFNRDIIIELAFITAGLYLLMSYPLAVLAGRLEKRLAQPQAGR